MTRGQNSASSAPRRDPQHPRNLLTEIIGTAVLVVGLLAILTPQNLVAELRLQGGPRPALVGLLVWSIGVSLAVRPAMRSIPRATSARASRTRAAHRGKRRIGLGYAWIRARPDRGGIAGAKLYKLLWAA